MLRPEVTGRVFDKLAALTARPEQSITVTGALSSDRCDFVLDLDSPTLDSLDDYPICIFETAETGVARVLLAAVEVAGVTTVGWRRPLPSSMAGITTAVIRTTPLAGAQFYALGGKARDRQVVMTDIMDVERPFAMGNQYGSTEQEVACTVLVTKNRVIPDDALDPLLYFKEKQEHDFLVGQVNHALHYAMDEELCRRIFIPHTRYSQWRREKTWTFAAELGITYKDTV